MMGWFGWLTKGHYEVSFLDKLIGFGELTLLIIVFVALYVSYQGIRNFFRSKK